MDDFLQFKGIVKEFPGVRALDGVSFGVRAGSVHGLVGENGAGKSTLLKILSGAYVPTYGTLTLDGRPCDFSNPKNAIDEGISVIYQELNLVPEMTVAENLLLGHMPVKKGMVDVRDLNRMAREELEYLMEDIDPQTKLKDLSIGQRQMIEIGKALLHDAKVIAFDEPTSSLSEKETRQLFRIINALRDEGRAIIYVSHRLNEIFEICDALTVFRDGKLIETFDDMSGVTHDDVVSRMVGRTITDVYGYRERPNGDTVLDVRDLFGPGVREPASFSVGKGEIVGFFGLVGAGRSELMRILYGDRGKSSGTIVLDGRELNLDSPSTALKEGIVFCPEDRKAEGIIPVRDVNENINISVRKAFLKGKFFLDKPRERANTEDFIEKLRIKTPGMEQMVSKLSGGNQQKVILARNLSMDTKLIILDEPTRGIDVGTKSEIYQLMYQLAEMGNAIVFVSSELPEVIGVSDRILVMSEGRIVAEVDRSDATEETVLNHALPEGSRDGASAIESGAKQ